MGFLAPAIPWAIKGGAALGSALIGKKAQSSAMKRSPEEAVDVAGAQGAGRGLAQTGGQQIAQGQPQQQQAGQYYSTLLRGNRAQMSQAVAAPAAALTDVYRGASRGLEQSGVRGAARDVAQGELTRSKASQIGSLVTGVQPAAAAALADLGTTQVNQGLGATAQSGNIFSNLLGQGFQNRTYARGEGEKTGTSMGGFLFDIMSGTLGSKFGKKGSIAGAKPVKLPIGNAPTGIPGTMPQY